MVTGKLTAIDVEGLSDGSYFTIKAGDNPTNGIAQINEESGEWNYAPHENYFGTDSFTITITDDLNGVSTHTIGVDM